ncbi:MAG: NAD(P)-dependent oxidoreductase [Proteobacteria bacterium]|nr:NAD(P)-dependent oxidoreductase [Pseudomonadota bacterium]
MKIAIIGATGNVGSRLVDEALSRGHQVTAVARNASRLPPDENLACAAADASDPEQLARSLEGHDVVMSATPFRLVKPGNLLGAVRRSGVKRYLVVGGAGSLEVAPGLALVDSPGFPALYREESLAGKTFLAALRQADDLDWTMLSPSASFTAGKRTGVFRLGHDSLLTAADGKSWVSFEDFAIAMLNEAERPEHIRQRFTVGY